MTSPVPRSMRLQKFLSDAGVASRRHAEEMILEGRVTVNGVVIDALPAFVDEQHDVVQVDGTRVRPQRLDYFIINKPRGVVCTNRDPGGRVRAVDLLPRLAARLFPVGRLDAESTGLLLMTNDGELALRLTHPRYGVAKTYRAEVRGRVPDDLPEQLRRGVHLAEGKARASDVEIVHASSQRSVLLITLHEGRNRQVRRMLARLGFPVRRLRRVQIGPLTLRGLPSGAARRLTPAELHALRNAVAESKPATIERTERRPRRAVSAVHRRAAEDVPDRSARPEPRDTSRGRPRSTPRRDQVAPRGPRRAGGPRPESRPPAPRGGAPGPRRRVVGPE